MNKKSNLIKIISLLLSVVLVTGLFGGCENGCNKTKDSTENIQTSWKDSEYSLVENGTSEFVIVVAEEPSEMETYAANELQKYLKKSSGVELPINSEKGLSLSASSRMLIVGRTALLKNSGITINDNDLGACGFIIKRKDGNMFMCGSQDLGSMYAVYQFLTFHFGFEAYQVSINDSLSEIYIDTGIKTKKLLDIDFSDTPDVQYRQAVGRYFSASSEIGYKLRYTSIPDAFIRESAYPWHNTMRLFPTDTYNNPSKPETYHPKWYIKEGGDEGNQLSVTARGDEAEKALLQQAILEKLTAAIERDFAEGKYSELVGFMQQDNGNWEEGSSMDYFREKYGVAANAASLICFINPVAKALAEYMEKNHPGRKMSIVIFAYWQTLEAPVKATANGYEPMSDEVKLEDNVSVLYAPIEADYTLPLDHEDNARYLDTMNRWTVLTKNLNFWIYSTYFPRYLMFYDSFDSIQSNLQILKRYNPEFVFNESRAQYGSSGFHCLKEYLTAKLLWDTEADVPTLTENFFKNYFKNASGPMMELYYEERTYFAYLKDYKNFSGWVFAQDVDNREFWPEKTIDSFLKYIDAAYEACEPLKEVDTLYYNTVKNRITNESLMFRYLKIKNYPSAWFSVDEYNAAIDEFMIDCDRLDVSMYSSSGSIKDHMLSLKR